MAATTQQLIDATRDALLLYAQTGFLRSKTVGDETISWSSPEEAEKFLAQLERRAAAESTVGGGGGGIKLSVAEFH